MNPRLLRPTQGGFSSPDADARAYLAAVRIADGSNLEPAVAKAISDFVIGCKTDGIWSAIKAAGILMGAKTLSGALTPLVGSAPTNNGPFVSGDYNRKTGLVGNGSSKYLDSNRNNNADPQNSKHIAVYRSVSGSGDRSCFGAGVSSTGDSASFTQGSGGAEFFTIHSFAYSSIASSSNEVGLLAASRTGISSTSLRAGSKTGSSGNGSQVPLSGNVLIFGRGTAASPNSLTNDRLAFYSIGESLDLSLLSSRLTTLYNAIGAAI
jgi:hypothetical protein